MLILAISILITGLICFVITIKALEWEEWFMFYMYFIITIICFLFSFLVLYEDSYKQGQIDALTGTIKYELVTQSDSTKTWERVKQ
jgi:tryptophan-rich sensory protein